MMSSARQLDTKSKSAPEGERENARIFPLFFAVGVLVYGIIYELQLDAPVGLHGAIVVSSTICALPILRSLASRRSLDVFEPLVVFTLAYYVLFVLRPIWELSSKVYLLGFLGYSYFPALENAIYISVVGYLSFWAGCVVAGQVTAGRLDSSRIMGLPSEAIRVRRWSLAFLILSVALYGVFVVRSGGTEFLRTLGGGRTSTLGSSLALSSGYLYSAPYFIQGLALWRLALVRRWLSLKAIPCWILLFYSIAPAITSGSRSNFLPALLGVVILRYSVCQRRPRAAALLLMLLVTFVFGITLPRVYRETSTDHISLSSSLSDSVFDTHANFSALLGGADTAMADALALETQVVPSVLQYQHGGTYAAALARPIPRELFGTSAKPQDADHILNEQLFPNLAQQGVGFSFSIFGEPWLNGGYIAVAVVLALFGYAYQRLYNWYVARPDEIFAIVVFAVSCPFIVVYMRGSIGTDYQRQVISLAPVLFVGWLVRRTHSNEAPVPHADRASLGRPI